MTFKEPLSPWSQRGRAGKVCSPPRDPAAASETTGRFRMGPRDCLVKSNIQLQNLDTNSFLWRHEREGGESHSSSPRLPGGNARERRCSLGGTPTAAPVGSAWSLLQESWPGTGSLPRGGLAPSRASAGDITPSAARLPELGHRGCKASPRPDCTASGFDTI